ERSDRGDGRPLCGGDHPSPGSGRGRRSRRGARRARRRLRRDTVMPPQGGIWRLCRRADRAGRHPLPPGVGVPLAGGGAMTGADGTVLLTGATGFVGMELLVRCLERTERHVLAIVRADSDESASERIDAVLANLFGDRAGRFGDRVTAVAGDMTAPGLGLDPARRDWLAAQSTMIVHCAASVSFALSLDEARA